MEVLIGIGVVIVAAILIYIETHTSDNLSKKLTEYHNYHQGRLSTSWDSETPSLKAVDFNGHIREYKKKIRKEQLKNNCIAIIEYHKQNEKELPLEDYINLMAMYKRIDLDGNK